MAIVFTTDQTNRGETTQRRHRRARTVERPTLLRALFPSTHLVPRELVRALLVGSLRRRASLRRLEKSTNELESWTARRPNANHRTPRTRPAHPSPHARACTPNANRSGRNGRAHEMRDCESRCGLWPWTDRCYRATQGRRSQQERSLRASPQTRSTTVRHCVHARVCDEAQTHLEVSSGDLRPCAGCLCTGHYFLRCRDAAGRE